MSLDLSPAELLSRLPDDDTWTAQTKRSLARLFAWFLICEDPQRRLEAHAVSPLAHQASIIQHILQEPHLRSVLIADEVGLGKTVEAGLAIKALLGQQPNLRVLYLAPAGLVANVREELARLGLRFRSWVAGGARDATLEDPLVVASIHRAVVPGNFETFAATQWDVIVVDECHHLSAYGPDGSSSRRKWRLVEEMRRRLSPDARLILLSGTPHQGHQERFENLVSLLVREGEEKDALAGRVVYRTKDDIRDWHGRPLFPRREVRPATVLDISSRHRAWLGSIHELFEPGTSQTSDAKQRAAGWRCAQALQWATSSIEAGLGYLVRQAVRAGWDPGRPEMADALAALRPYRDGLPDEDLWPLFERLKREVHRQDEAGDLQDAEDSDGVTAGWRPEPGALSQALRNGIALLQVEKDKKWDALYDRVLVGAGSEKVVLFAQPIETVTALARYLERRSGVRPSLVIGGQSEIARRQEIERFWDASGPQYLVSSRAGGEGINLQVARRIVHVDVPWNPMEMEQRVGRVHRFLSRRTILVDTLVVADSREADMYDVARAKLRDIALDLARDEETLQTLFTRVMALVAPEELQGVLSREAMGPLSAADRREIATLVQSGYANWEQFHRRFAAAKDQLRALDAGAAEWSDLRKFAEQHLGATKVSGFEVLAFDADTAEVTQDAQSAEVLQIGADLLACGDHGGMPITGGDGKRVRQMGVNTSETQVTLRRLAFPTAATGAAHVRWPVDAPVLSELDRPFGLLVLLRLPYRLAGGQTVELDGEMKVFRLGSGDALAVELESGETSAATIRGLLGSAVRREPASATELAQRLLEEETRLVSLLRQLRPGEREHQIYPTVVPLVAAIVS